MSLALPWRGTLIKCVLTAQRVDKRSNTQSLSERNKADIAHEVRQPRGVSHGHIYSWLCTVCDCGHIVMMFQVSFVSFVMLFIYDIYFRHINCFHFACACLSTTVYHLPFSTRAATPPVHRTETLYLILQMRSPYTRFRYRLNTHLCQRDTTRWLTVHATTQSQCNC